jgi:hypothetical protein
MNTSHEPSSIVVSDVLRKKMSALISIELAHSSLFTDLGDIYEICRWYVSCVDKFSSSHVVVDRDALQTWLIEVETQIVTHAGLHVNALKQHLPKIIDQLDCEEKLPKKRIKQQKKKV